MSSKPIPIFGIKELAEWTKERILNRFDSNIIVTGTTGSGKSTFLDKFFKCFKDFDINKQLTFSRTEMIDLIKNQKFGYIWQDELINSGFKRNFFEREQISLIETLTKYRSNFNVVGGALPIFFTLDKELLKLFGLHINIIRRGIGVIHMPITGRLYSDDPWDTKINAKLEEVWSKKKLKNPAFKVPYHKYTTFVGYVFFSPLTEEEEEEYNNLKESKRKEAEDTTKEEQHKVSFYDKIITMLKDGKLSEDEFVRICEYENKSYTSVKTRVNQLLRDKCDDKRVKDYLREQPKKSSSNKLYNNNTNPHLNDILTMDV